ncbi:unnamed protein product, partial [Rangifer tarandus platyrhynchus]
GAGPVRSARTAPARSPQGRGEQGAQAADRARTLRTACSHVRTGAAGLRACRQILYSRVSREAQDPYIRTFK